MPRPTPPRICILAEAFYPLGGGVGTYGLALARELRRQGIRTLVLTRRERPELKPVERVDGVTILRLPPTGRKRLGKYLLLLPAALRLIQLRRQYDIIYVFGLRVLGSIAVPLGFLLGKPVLLRAEQTGEANGRFVWQARRRGGLLLRGAVALAMAARNALLRRATCFVAISRDIEQEFRQVGFAPGRIRPLPNGVDTDRFHPADESERLRLRGELDLPSGFLVLYAGRLHRDKGLFTLVEAWREMAGGHPESHLVIVGGDSTVCGCEPELRSRVNELKLGDRVIFTGPRPNVGDYLRAADAFVLPSEREGFSIALLEAMACGLPVVGTPASGNSELILPGETGYLVPHRNPAALAAALQRLATDPAAGRRMGTAARRRVTGLYSLDLAVGRHLDLLAELSGYVGPARSPASQEGILRPMSVNSRSFSGR